MRPGRHHTRALRPAERPRAWQQPRPGRLSRLPHRRPAKDPGAPQGAPRHVQPGPGGRRGSDQIRARQEDRGDGGGGDQRVCRDSGLQDPRCAFDSRMQPRVCMPTLACNNWLHACNPTRRLQPLVNPPIPPLSSPSPKRTPQAPVSTASCSATACRTRRPSSASTFSGGTRSHSTPWQRWAHLGRTRGRGRAAAAAEGSACRGRMRHPSSPPHQQPSTFNQNSKPQELFPGDYAPTPAHFFLRLLADRGLLLRVFTQVGRGRSLRGAATDLRAGGRTHGAAAACALARSNTTSHHACAKLNKPLKTQTAPTPEH
jgi:hypothetical protein